MEKGFLEDCLAQGMSLKAIGKLTGKHASTVGYWLRKHGLTAAGAAKYAPRGRPPRGELEILARSGASLAEMGQHFERSASTIQYWLRSYGIDLLRKRRKGPHGARGTVAVFDCARHGRGEFVLEGRGYYRCKRCRAAGVAKRRRTVKRQLVEEAGGACFLCGYSRCLGALQFHHIRPEAKEFHLAVGGYSRSIARSRAEMRKCVLLCANCHAEVEGGFATLPDVLRRSDASGAED